jgi:group I intron endonuclease
MILYQVINRYNQKRYIGITKHSDVNKRWRQHCYGANASRTLFAAAIRRYGRESFDVFVLRLAVSIEELRCVETWAIMAYETLAPGGYNLTTGGDYPRLHPDSTARGAAKRRGRKASVAHREAISRAHKGKKHSPEHAAKSGLAHRGKTISTAMREKISLALSGRAFSESHQLNVAAMLVSRNKSVVQIEAVREAHRSRRGARRARIAGMPIMKMAEARRLGLPQYFTGRECRFGHLAPRLTANGDCTDCSNRKRRLRSGYDADVLERPIEQSAEAPDAGARSGASEGA